MASAVGSKVDPEKIEVQEPTMEQTSKVKGDTLSPRDMGEPIVSEIEDVPGKMSVLQRLKAREGALRVASSGVDLNGASGYPMSDIKTEQQPQSRESDEGIAKISVPVEIIEMTYVAEASSKSGYDPRTDDREEWRALMQRSAIGKTQLGSSDDKGMWVAKDGSKGWMPPALTTYGENKYSPEQQLVDCERPEPPGATQWQNVVNIQYKGSATEMRQPSTPAKEVTSIPIQEIEIGPPAEDESSLGSMGHLFPPAPLPIYDTARVEEMNSAEPTRNDPQLLSHKMKPTVAGVDYDYYRSWILPGVQPPPRPKSTVMMNDNKADPPDDTNEFRPGRTVKTAYTPPDRPTVRNVVRDWESSEPFSQGAVPEDTRLEYDAVRGQPTDEWERWRLARIMEQDMLSESSTKRSTRSYASSTSNWAPPGKPRPLHNVLDTKSSKANSPVSTWILPARVSRLDFAGLVSSQVAPSATQLGSQVAPSATQLGDAASKSSSSSSSSSSSALSSDDTDAIFDACGTQTVSKASAPISLKTSDLEQGRVATETTSGLKAAERGYRRQVLCLCILLGFLVIAGGTTAAVLFLGDFLPLTKSSPSEPTFSPTFSPVMQPNVAPIGIDPTTVPTLPTVVLPTPPQSSPSLPPATPAEDEDLSDDALYELIIARYPDGAAALADLSSPQRMAFEWLRSSVNSQIKSTLALLQRYALASLFYSTNGAEWESSAAWLSSAGECTWSTTAVSGSMCDSEGNLVEISQRDNNLKGELPGEVLLLWNSLGMYGYGYASILYHMFRSTLTSPTEILDLQGNAISGSIPKSVAGLGRLGKCFARAA
jgi:hypothetical protein